jgi:hypothetical protein
MRNKRLLLLSGGALIALLLVGTLGATAVFAQEPTPDPEAPAGRLGLGRGRGLFGFGRGGDWTMFDTAAEALGLTPEEFFAELHSGKSVKEIAEEQGVEMETLKDALETARVEAMQEAIKQAVEDGKMTQEQADWLLEGLDQGFIPRGRGFGPGRGWNGTSGTSDT